MYQLASSDPKAARIMPKFILSIRPNNALMLRSVLKFFRHNLSIKE